MPQLDFIFWFFNFLVGWLILIIVFFLMLNKTNFSNNINSPAALLEASYNNNWLWT
nr:ATP synthase F0 subunit 8 [Paulasterias sp. SS-2022]